MLFGQHAVPVSVGCAFPPDPRLVRLDVDAVLGICEAEPDSLGPEEQELQIILHSASLEDLVDWFYGDCDWAFEILSRRLYPVLYEAPESPSPEETRAIIAKKDAAQETLIKFFATRARESARYKRSKGRFVAWLRTLTHHITVDTFRAKDRNDYSLDDPASANSATGGELTIGQGLESSNHRGVPEPNREQEMVAADEEEARKAFASAFQRCVAAVAGRPGEIIRLVAEGLEPDDIAARLGISEKNVYVQRKRGFTQACALLLEDGYVVVPLGGCVEIIRRRVEKSIYKRCLPTSRDDVVNRIIAAALQACADLDLPDSLNNVAVLISGSACRQSPEGAVFPLSGSDLITAATAGLIEKTLAAPQRLYLIVAAALALAEITPEDMPLIARARDAAIRGIQDDFQDAADRVARQFNILVPSWNTPERISVVWTIARQLVDLVRDGCLPNVFPCVCRYGNFAAHRLYREESARV